MFNKQKDIRAVKIILVYLAASIVMVHTVLPHQHHHDESVDYEYTDLYQETISVFDYLKLMVNVDLGDGHMENFNEEKSLEYEIGFPVDLFPDLEKISKFQPLVLILIVMDKAVKFIYHDAPIKKTIDIAHLFFRGPPSLA